MINKIQDHRSETSVTNDGGRLEVRRYQPSETSVAGREMEKGFPRVSMQRLCSIGGHGCTLGLHLNLAMCKSHPGGTGFEAMKGSRRTAEVGARTRP